MAFKLNEDQQAVSKILGFKKVNKQRELDQINAYISSGQYKKPTATTTQTATPAATETKKDLKISGIFNQPYSFGNNNPLAGYTQKQITAAASQLGISNINKEREAQAVANFIDRSKASMTDPLYIQAAKNAGIQNYNTINDYNQVLNRIAGTVAPAATTPAASNTPTSNVPEATYTPTPLVPDEPLAIPETTMPTTTSPTSSTTASSAMFAPGGPGSNVDGQAMGFRRPKSKARMAGLTTKGTSQFKITGQNARSSGLNIGV